VQKVEQIAFHHRFGRGCRAVLDDFRASARSGWCTGRHANLQRVEWVGLYSRLDARPHLHIFGARPGRVLPRHDLAVRRRYRLHDRRRPDLDRGSAHRDASPGRPRLAGNYGGGSANVTIGIGIGANALVGGSNNTVALQPLSLDGNRGLNVAGGIAALTLSPAG
jgi:hypothetical protein